MKKFMLLCTFFLLPVAAANAHHSLAMFDASKEVTVKGIVKKFQWTNPHSWLFVNVAATADKAETEWTIEMQAVSILTKQGWKSTTLKPGDAVSVIINPMRDGTNGGVMKTVIQADGTTFAFGIGKVDAKK